MRFAVLAACRNRLAMTSAFVDFWTGAPSPQDQFQIFILDDGSTDGTVEFLEKRQDVTLVRGDGSYYWNGAMARLVDIAVEDDFDAVILANDDIELFEGALGTTLALYKQLNATQATAVVGAFRGSTGEQTTFGGLNRRSYRSPLALQIARPQAPFSPCDTFHGNFVIVPAASLRLIGGMKKVYQHAFGDLDLGFRLKKAGIRLAVTPDHIGICDPGPSLEARTEGKNMYGRFKIAFGRHRSAHDYQHFMLAHAPLIAPLGICKDILGRIGLGLFGHRK